MSKRLTWFILAGLLLGGLLGWGLNVGLSGSEAGTRQIDDVAYWLDIPTQMLNYKI